MKGERQVNADWILKAIDVIKSGIANKLVKDNISVYKVGDNIRIDISGAMKDWYKSNIWLQCEFKRKELKYPN